MRAVLTALEPRDRLSAARAWWVVVLFGGAATLAWELLAQLQDRPGATAASALSAVAVVAVYVLVAVAQRWWTDRVPVLVWPAVAVLAPVVTVLVAVSVDDPSAAGQLGLVYAVVYGASQFRRGFAWGITVFAVLCDAVIVLTLLPVGDALRDLLLAATTLPVITAVLMTAGRERERLIDEQRRLIASLDELASTDDLTGLLTRRSLSAAAEAALVTGRPGDVRPHVGLVLLDVDGFKQVNDVHGHPAGDAALVELAAALRAVAGPSDVLARIGGDELAVLVRGTGPTVDERARALHTAARSSGAGTAGAGTAGAGTAGSPLRLTVSVGYAVARPGWSFDDLYAAADRALYAAKGSGRDRVAAARPEPDPDPEPQPDPEPDLV
ncbi:GGDEF domain-containing protein [Cellulomonas marina]|uniref:Diguanylate cyclase (GGDEF) domain-containing protein n=1 Tax=Cellulomonas marina TaxID=988821 RepID=A0A1I0YG89_9CELL|nr:GGDEF domain-containing protein [Cellulomonas marina]GIG28759.1 hypothetical protein Cma02nite_13590 [Cellulomonas marina]SFB11378.1 diguanylate cyclase (GGDEF) domain-containing protein [Cellulomonas marina]